MPRLVDHAVRRDELAGALWRVVRRDGIHRVSVRTVAAEADTSPSSLRHYFATQDELLGFALRSVVDRVWGRVLPLLPELHGRSGAVQLLEQLLPLDVDRRDEVEVYLAFSARAHVDPALREIRDEAENAARAGVRHAVALLVEGSGRDVEAEADVVYPLVDGLALHGTLWPDRYPSAHLQRVLHAHLDRLAPPA